MITREQKESVVAGMRDRFSRAQAVFIAENAGLTAEQMMQFRRNIRSASGVAQVAKNTLAQRAMKDSPFEVLGEGLSGPLIYGAAEDAAAVAKVFSDTAKDNEKFIIRGGALAEGVLLDAAAVAKLASIPPRAQLLAMLASAMQAPMSGLVRTLNEVPSRMVRSLAALRDQKSGGDS